MTILHAVREKISGVFHQGHRISCHTCHGTNFFPDTKHLPPDVVQKKFQQRGWEVLEDDGGKHYCSNCIDKRRFAKRAKVGVAGAAEKQLRAVREIQYANGKNVRTLVAGIGLIPTEVIELEHKHKRFKITFRNAKSISIGRVNVAEGELVEGLNGTLIDSSLKFEMAHREEQGAFIFEPVIHWFITLEIQQRNVVPLFTPTAQQQGLRVAAE